MTTRIEFTYEAREQALAAARWWRANRDEVDAFEDELAIALDARARSSARAGRRRDRRKARAQSALWHAARGSGPHLP